MNVGTTMTCIDLDTDGFAEVVRSAAVVFDEGGVE